MTDAKAAFNQQLKNKMAGKSTEKAPNPEELVARAGAALEELQVVTSELAVAPAPEEVPGAEDEEKTK